MWRGISVVHLAVLGALSCRGDAPVATPDARSLGPTASTQPAESTAPKVAVPAPRARIPAITVLAPPKTISLQAEVRPVPSRSSALLTHSNLLGGYSYVRRIDAQQRLGRVHTLSDRQPVTWLDGQHAWLVTSRGTEVCLERFDTPAAPVCHRVRADFVVLVGGLPVLLEQREDAPKKTHAPAKKVPTPRPRNRRKPKSQKKPRVYKPIAVRLWIHRLDADGQRRGKQIDTGLVVKMPLPGMGVIAAASHPSGIRVVHYQHHKPRREGRRWIKQAKLMSALIGVNGKLLRGTGREIYRGDRAYGYIETHREPRLFGSGVLVGRFVDSQATPTISRWEARRLGPVRTVPTPNAVLGVDPWRLRNPRIVGATELSALSALYDAAPRLAVGQPATEAGRVAWVGERGYFLRAGALSSASRKDGTVRDEPEPFAAKRSRMRWATLKADGSGLAQTSAGLVEIYADGRTTLRAAQHPPPLSEPVRIGSAWWAVVPRGNAGSGGAVVRLLPSPAEAKVLSGHAYADAHAIVAGAKTGRFISLSGGRLTSWLLTSEGVVTQLSTVASSLGPGIAAVARRAGGALVVGRTARGAEPMALALDHAGKIVGEHKLNLPSDGQLSIVTLRRGAVVFDRLRTQVVWLDEDAHPVGRADWAPPATPVACVDGNPARDSAPSDTPGTMTPIGKLAGAHCWSVPFPVRAADGHRWLGTVVDGMHSQAVLAALPAPKLAIAPVADTPLTNTIAQPALAPPTCPPDMVSIGGRFCIDRFETQLVDSSAGQPLSPDYPSTPGILEPIFRAYAARRWNMGDLRAQAMPLPPLLRVPTSMPKPIARSRYDVRPSGFLTWHVASRACSAAGKRLCDQTEWVTACRGEQDRKFPYGDDFAHGRCNVWRFAHPAAALHGNASVGHLDPRLNRVLDGKRPLLHTTGQTKRCASRWGKDAVYDMVGNLDEWVAHKNGAFAGGFYSRTTKKGCDALISAHPKRYLDYSLGTRCCRHVTK